MYRLKQLYMINALSFFSNLLLSVLLYGSLYLLALFSSCNVCDSELCWVHS